MRTFSELSEKDSERVIAWLEGSNPVHHRYVMLGVRDERASIPMQAETGVCLFNSRPRLRLLLVTPTGKPRDVQGMLANCPLAELAEQDYARYANTVFAGIPADRRWRTGIDQARQFNLPLAVCLVGKTMVRRAPRTVLFTNALLSPTRILQEMRQAAGLS